METSLFSTYVQKWFGAIISAIYTTLNGSKAEPTYLFKKMLKKKYSPTLKWDSLSSDGSIVAADVVSLNSSLPLKKRDSLSKANGDIPKLGLKLSLNEQQLNDINIMKATGASETAIVEKIFDDAGRVVSAVYERLEFMFLEALSTGSTIIQDVDSKNTGVGVRVDYGYLAANKKGVNTLWTGALKPITDFEYMLSLAESNGYKPNKVLMSRESWNQFRAAQEVKDLFAFNNGFAGANVIKPTLSQVNDALNANYGLTIEIVDRTVRTEKNGVQTLTKPWATGQIVFCNDGAIGDLTWGNTAEKTNPAKQAMYQTVDEYILVSKYSALDPITEYTAAQALVVPIVNNVQSIFILDTLNVLV